MTKEKLEKWLEDYCTRSCFVQDAWSLDKSRYILKVLHQVSTTTYIDVRKCLDLDTDTMDTMIDFYIVSKDGNVPRVKWQTSYDVTTIDLIIVTNDIVMVM